ncbi:hypothetical protein LXL04_025438 [Taraxacum kok-saghyz]
MGAWLPLIQLPLIKNVDNVSSRPPTHHETYNLSCKKKCVFLILPELTKAQNRGPSYPELYRFSPNSNSNTIFRFNFCVIFELKTNQKAKMASSSSKFLRRVSTSLCSIHNHSHFLSSSSNSRFFLEHSNFALPPSSSLLCNHNHSRVGSRDFCSRTSNIDQVLSQGPAIIDYSSLLQEDEFHKLADTTINDLLEKIEEYGDSVDIDGFDIDYGNQVLTVKFGDLGTYVLNKQTPNRQIWMSSPVSGPSRFDWDQNGEGWIYRRTKAKLLETLENEIQQLCGDPIRLS